MTVKPTTKNSYVIIIYSTKILSGLLCNKLNFEF